MIIFAVILLILCAVVTIGAIIDDKQNTHEVVWFPLALALFFTLYLMGVGR